MLVLISASIWMEQSTFYEPVAQDLVLCNEIIRCHKHFLDIDKSEVPGIATWFSTSNKLFLKAETPSPKELSFF